MAYNYSSDFENHAYKSIKPFSAFIRTKFEPSNASYGSSRIYQPVWREKTFSKDTILFDLHGGTFVPLEGKCYSIQLEKPKQFMAFTHSLGNRRDDIPKDKFIRDDTLMTKWKEMCQGKYV